MKPFDLLHSTMKPLVIMLRLAIATALILPVSIIFADPIVRVLLPLYRALFELIGDDYNIIYFGLVAQGVENVIRVDVSLAHTLVVGGHMVWPDPRGIANVTTSAVQALQPATIALIAVLGWPCPSLQRWILRLLPLLFFLLLITMVDVPFLLAGEMLGLIIDNVSPGTTSALVSWSQFLAGGGRLILGLFAALASFAVENVFAQWGRVVSPNDQLH